ncbi:MAG: hypothetical protein B7Y35_14015 [Sphingomonadales bacterium 28-64-96]|nr:MAG: hypothetical protein B7Y35_14015 [Sphingomonadales bacterium 28-64-96]
MADPLAVQLRFGLYGVLGLLFGLLAFRQYAPAHKAAEGGFRALAGLAAIGVLLSGLALFELAGRMHGLTLANVSVNEVATILTLPGVGSAFSVRIAALLLAMVLLLRRGGGLLALAFAGTALISLAWQGHAGATDGRSGLLHLVATALHLLAAGIWLGALTALLHIAMRAARSDLELSHFSTALTRFHGVGIAVVATLAVTGSTAFFIIAGSPLSASAFQSQWWWLMSGKLLAFFCMLALAAANRFWLAPVLAAGHPRGVQSIKTTIVFELVLAITILALVAWLGLLAPYPG